MFDHISKYWEESWKYDEQQSIFDELWDALKCGYIFSIKTKTKEKTNKIVKIYVNF